MNILLKKFYGQIIFICKFKILHKIIFLFRTLIYKFYGMQIGNETFLPTINVTWPHQVKIGNECILEPNIIFKYDGIWKPGPSITIEDNVFIGSNCEFNINTSITISKYSNIASGCKFIDHNHGTKEGQLIGPQPSVKEKIVIGKDVWLGCNCIILKGVIIGDGAVVGAGSVVVKSIPPNEIWAGVPAKYIKIRS
jgi:acetyltransferase-like isoleucine patch superfamily enzyme